MRVGVHVPAVLAALAAWACAHAPGPALPPAPPPAAVHGSVAQRFIVDPQSAPPELPPDHEFVPPWSLGEHAAPGYPPKALAAEATATVVLRITIDSTGRISRLEDSPVMASSTGPFAPDFRTAVEEAVWSWRFTPGLIQQLEEGNDLDGDGKPDYVKVVHSYPVQVFYDVRFDFEIEDGAGRVRSSVDQ